MKKSTKIAIGIGAVVVLLCALLLVYKNFAPTATTGSKAYTLEVVDADGETTSYSGSTDAEYLSDLMDELVEEDDFSYSGSESDYGIMITEINGVTADYDKDQAYWSIYVNGEYGQYGADAQPVSDGDAYQFVYESAQ